MSEREPGDGEEPALLGELRALREDPPEAGFSSALHRRLVAAGPPEPASAGDWLRQFLRRRGPVLWPSLGLAAGIAAFLVLSAGQPAPAPGPLAEQSAQALATPGTVVPASKVAVIKLDFTTDVAVEEADFQVSLPEGRAFWSDGEELPLRLFRLTEPVYVVCKVVEVALLVV